MMKNRFLILLCLLAVARVCVAAPDPSTASSGLPVLVKGMDGGVQMFSMAPEPEPADLHETRVRVVEVDTAFLPAAARRSARAFPAEDIAPEQVVLEIFPDVVVTGIVQHAETHASGVTSLYGTLAGRDGGQFNLTSRNGILLGTIMPVNTNGLVYHIRFRQSLGGVHVATETDISGLHFGCGTCQPDVITAE